MNCLFCPNTEIKLHSATKDAYYCPKCGTYYWHHKNGIIREYCVHIKTTDNEYNAHHLFDEKGQFCEFSLWFAGRDSPIRLSSNPNITPSNIKEKLKFLFVFS